jgi:hypothetical protein
MAVAGNRGFGHVRLNRGYRLLLGPGARVGRGASCGKGSSGVIQLWMLHE